MAALLLDIWQDQWQNQAYLCLLPLFSAQAISASLAFIFISYQVCYHVAADVVCGARTSTHMQRHGSSKELVRWPDLSTTILHVVVDNDISPYLFSNVLRAM